MFADDLKAVLDRVARRLTAVNVLAGFGWAVVVGVVALLVAMWLDLLWELPGTVRFSCLVGAIVLGVGVLGWVVARTLKRRSPQMLARRLDEVGGTGGEILSGTDLMSQPQTAPVSSHLAGLAIKQAGRKAQAVSAAAAVPAKPVKWSWGSLTGIAAVVVLLGLLLPRVAWTQWTRFSDPFGDHPAYSRVIYNVKPGNVKVIYGQGFDINVRTEGTGVERVDIVLQTNDVQGEEVLPMFPGADGTWQAVIAQVTTPGTYFVRSHAGRSEKFRIDVVTVPKIESVRFKVTLPEYTNRTPYEGPVPQGGLAGLLGTKVEVWARSNRPLASGKMELLAEAGKTVAIDLQSTQQGGSEVSGSFTIAEAGKLDLRVRDEAGQMSTDVFTAPVNVINDERPFVRILEPREVSFATPSAAVPVSIAAEDDFGISRLQLFRSLNDSRALPFEFTVKKPAPMRLLETYTLNLSTLGVQPGDEIKLFARVEDTDPNGPKGSESPVVIIRIVAQADFEKMLRQRQGLDMLISKYQQAQRRLENIAEEMVKIEKNAKDEDRELTPQEREQLGKLAEQMQKEAEAIENSAKHELPYDVDKAMSKHLEKMAEQLKESSKDVKKMAGKPGMKPRQMTEEMKKLREKLAGQKKELEEQTTEPLEHLAKVYPLLEDSQKFVELYLRQKDLTERLASLKGKEKPDDPAMKARMRDLQAEQLELRQSLARLLDEIEDHVSQLPDDPELDKLRESAQTFAADVRSSGALEAMDQAEAALGSFQGTAGHEGAEQARAILEKFLSKCQNGGIPSDCKGCLKFSPSLSDCMGNTLEQLLGESGLGMGMDGPNGFGAGAGSGYSARRHSNQNVGMYGQLPTLGEMTSQSGRNSGDVSGRLAQRGRGKANPGSPQSYDSETKRGTAGVAGAVVPAPYRRRVADYFQRIADEAGGSVPGKK